MTFLSVEEGRRIELDHDPEPHFLLTVEFDSMGDATKVTFRQSFDSPEICEAVRGVCVPGNEDNFDRLSALIAASP